MTSPLSDDAVATTAIEPSHGRATCAWHALLDVLTLTLPPAGLCALGWQRRWITDDGLILARTVRQILAGHGPVFNSGERVEADTSALWTWLVAGVAWLTRADVYGVIEVLGLVLGPLGLFFALLGSRTLYRRLNPGRPIVPLGAGLIVALPPFWDFVTSGLETALIFCWLGLSWWLLTGLPGAGRGRAYTAAFVIGLGWLVRPDMLIVSVCLAAALIAIRRPTWPAAAGLTAVASAVPLGYELFRMGYYGLLVPNTALAKDASTASPAQGFRYLSNYVATYLLWVPLVVLLAVALLLFIRGRADADCTILAVAAVAAALLMAAYVVWVGGDFMHARMLLPPTFTLLLPVMAVSAPADAWWPRVALASGVMGVAAWAVICGLYLRMPQSLMTWNADGITNERAFWVERTGDLNPVTPAPYIAMVAGTDDPATALQRIAGFTPSPRDPRLIYLNAKRMITSVPLDRPGASMAVSTDVLGTMGAIVPLDGIVIDVHGLAYPYASHTYPIPGGRIGHGKAIGNTWIIADYASLSVTDPQITAARTALACGDLARLAQATRAPLTWGRFWGNVGGSYSLTTFRFPDNPTAGRDALCG